jgi:OmpA-OmpF porin, OOP family
VKRTHTPTLARAIGTASLLLCACVPVESLLAQTAAPASSPTSSPSRPAVSEKVTVAGELYFDEGSSAIKPGAATVKLEDFVRRVGGVNLEVIIAVGHTDSMESAAPGQLSTSRAEAFKAYMASRGVEGARVYTEGKGSTQPVADNKTPDGRGKNRRVEFQAVGTRERR